MTYRLATIRTNAKSIPAIEVSGQHYNLAAILTDLFPEGGRGLIDLFKNWDAALDRMEKIAREVTRYEFAKISPELQDFETPLQYPNKLLLGGANYYEHMFKDAGKPDFRKEDGTPVFFLKPPTTSLVGCGDTVPYPAETRKLDWEIELAVIVAKRLRRASIEDAMEAVAGYAVGLDMSSRDWQMNPRHPWKFDLFTGKAFDCGCPLGPYIVPKSFVDVGNLAMTLKVNGEIKQDANTNDMIWSVGEQLSLLSEFVTLEPGDVLLTGTPAGVGLATGTFLNVGDILEAEIEGLGRLTVKITPPQGSERTPRVL